MAGLEATHVVVAGTGAVWVAPEGTPPPAALAAPSAPWVDVGYVGEDGATFSLTRETEEILAWQSAEAVRVLVTSEPKTVAFELLEFDRESVLLAFRGGTFAGSASPYTYTPPAAGASDVRAMLVDGIDGDDTFRFVLPRVELQGDLEWSLVKSDAVRLPLEFAILASTPSWSIESDSEAWAVGVAGMSMPRTHAELDAMAAAQGVTFAEGATVQEKQETLEAGALAAV